MKPEWHEELQTLCAAAVDDRLSDEQTRRLEELVLAHPEARRYYVEYLHQHAALHWSMGEPGLLTQGKVEVAAPEKRPTSRWKMLTVGLLAASVLIAVLAWFGARETQAAGPLATLAEAKACKWESGTLPTETGAALGKGRLRLAEGIARVVFSNGAEITLEAPAELEIVSAERCILASGRLTAKVPPQAIGFVVDTPTAVLKDLGTEFGVNVRDGQADVQVFNGIVDVQHRASGKTDRLLTGGNRRFFADRVVELDASAEPAGPNVPTPPTPAEGTRVVHISTAMGKGKDCYIQPIVPKNNFSSILLLIKNTRDSNQDMNRKAYLGLDLAAVAGQQVTDAQLSFTFTPTGMGFGSELPDSTFAVFGLLDESLDGWDEKTTRWQNAPANVVGGAALDPEKVVRLGSFVVGQGEQTGTRSISGPALVDFLNRDSNGLATFILVRETAGLGARANLVHGFAGKNHPTLAPPTLKLTVTPK